LMGYVQGEKSVRLVILERNHNFFK
jgi:hypothetical protein